MRVALSAQVVRVCFGEEKEIYPFRLDQLLLTGPLFDILTLAKNQSDAVFFVNPFVLLGLAGISYSYEENTARFIEDCWPRALNMIQLESEPQTNPGLETISSLRSWCKGGKSCRVQWETVSALQDYLFAEKLHVNTIPLPLCLYSLLSTFRTSYQHAAYDLFMRFFYARDIFDDFAQTGFILMSSAFARNLSLVLSDEGENEQFSIYPREESKKPLQKWRHYNICFEVYKNMVSWVRKNNFEIYSGQFNQKKRVGAVHVSEFFDRFLSETHLQEKVATQVKHDTYSCLSRLWSQFLWRLVSRDVDPEADARHIIVL